MENFTFNNSIHSGVYNTEKGITTAKGKILIRIVVERKKILHILCENTM